jgi:phage terminase small subunit
MSLTLKQKLFVSFYCGTSQGNAVDAARRAGYRWPDKQGSQLLGKTRIRAAIDARVSGLVMPQDEILVRLGEIAGADLLDFITGDTSADIAVDLKRARRRGQGFLLKRLKTTKGELDIELKDSIAAMTLIGKYYGMWDREVPPAISLVELAKRLRERAKGAAQP